MPSKKQSSRRPSVTRRAATRKSPKRLATKPPPLPDHAAGGDLAALLADLPIGVYRTTPDGRILFANPALIKMLGYSSFTQLARRNLEKSYFGPPHARQEFKERMAREGEIRGLEVQWQRKDGSTIVVRENARAIRGADGRIRWYEGTVEDITRAQTVEKAVREERARLWTVLEALPATVCLQGPDHRLRFSNAAFRERFGGNHASPCYEEREGRSSPCPACPTAQVFETGQAVRREWTDPAGRTYVLHSLPFCDTDGSPLVLSIGIDITERKRAEEALRHSEEKYRRIVETAQEGIWAMDERFITTYVNARLTAMLGYAAEEMLGQPVHAFMFEQDLPDHHRQMQARQSGESSIYERRFRRKDGSECWTIVSATPLRDEEGAFAGSFAMFTDITDRKRVERENALLARFPAEDPNPVLRIARDGTLLYANAAAKSLWESRNPQTNQPVREYLRERAADTLNAGEPAEEEVSADGRVFGITFVPIRDAGYVNLYGRDLTDRRKAENALRAAHAMLNDLVRSIPSGLFIYEYREPDRLILTAANPEAERLTGIRLEDWLGREFNEIWPTARDRGITAHCLEAVRSGVMFETEDLEYRDDRLTGIFRVRAFRLPENRLGAAFEDVTERRRSEDALRRSEATLRGILRAAPIGIGTVTRRVLGWVNSQVEQITGYSLEELRGQSARMLYPDDAEYERVGAEKYAQIRERGLGSLESRWRRKDGTIIDVLLSSSPVEEGDLDGEVVFTVLDITQRKEAERAMKEKAEELDAFFSSALDLLAIADTDGYFRRLNREWETTLGYPLHELTGRRFLDLVHPEDQPGTLEAIRMLDKAQQPILNFTNRYRCADGSYRWIEWRSTPKGRVIYATARDITDRRRSEEALREAHAQLERRVEERTLELAHANEELTAEVAERRRAEDALRESHALLESVLLNTSDQVYLKDLEGRYVFVNPAAAEAMQRPAADIIGHTDADLYPPELAEPLLREDRQVIETGKPLSYGRSMTLHDRLRYNLTTKVAHRDADGRVIGVLGIGRDITDYRETQERVARAERLGSIGVLAAGLAHEINNPVGMILLSAENAIALRNEPDAARIMERTLRNIINDAERCSRIVKNLLRFARQERTAKTPGDLNTVLERAGVAMRNIVRPTGAVIETAFTPNLPQVLMNPVEMSQVFVNLIQNAVSSAERPVRVCLRTERTATGVRVVVEDDGEGLTEEERKHIFEPFYTTRRTRGGMGLGLSVGHGIVTEHGGSVEVRSRLGHGTTVIVDLPAIAEGQAAESEHAESAGRG